jgi:acyl-CoA thioester hydrolase
MQSDPRKTFSLALSVGTEDIDEMNHVNNVVYIRWVQEVAEAHWLTVASAEMRQRYQWVVLRHEIDYKYPVLLGDDLSGTTWVGTHHGARFERFVQLENPGTSRIYAQAKTIWCLLDGRTKKPLRIPDEVLALL